MPTRVLIVEDDDDIRETLLEVLSDNGFEPSSAANGAEALTFLRDHTDSKPHVILLDMMMPVLDGWGFRSAQLADPSLRSIPVIVLTAHASIEETAAALGVTGFLRKPVRLDPLLDAIRRHAAMSD